MLCNVIVRATHELHVHQQKNKDEIQNFLTNDCQQLKNSQLVEKVRRKEKKENINSSIVFLKCEDLVERHGAEIYAHVASNIVSLIEYFNKINIIFIHHRNYQKSVIILILLLFKYDDLLFQTIIRISV
jgi:hypothetical protein